MASTGPTEGNAHQKLLSHFQEMIGAERVVSFTRRSAPEEPVKETLLVRQDSHASADKDAKALEQDSSHDPSGGVAPMDGSSDVDLAQLDLRENEAPFICDRCGEGVDGLRMQCEQCPNFDYCPGCHQDASRIHPGHTFKPMLGRRPAPEGNYNYKRRPEFIAMEKEDLPLARHGDGSSQPEHLCKSCRDVSETFWLWHKIYASKSASIRAAYAQDWAKDPRKWHVRVTGLAEATALGCLFCSYFLKKMFGPTSFVNFSYRADNTWLGSDDAAKMRKETLKRAMDLSTKLSADWFKFRIKPVLKSRARPGEPWLEKIVLTCVQAGCKQDMVQECFGPRGAVEIELMAFASRGNAASQDVGLAPNPDVGSSESLSRAQAWWRTCREEHEKACSVTLTEPPTRLIEVSDEQSYRVVQSSATKPTEYCALSYQWGGPQEFQLSSHTFADLSEGFAPSELPQAIADAAKVARSLSIPYLWVDALCILQDDPEDKAREIENMGNVYRNSTVTIIAANATSAKSGFLMPHSDASTGSWPTLIPIKYPLAEPEVLDLQAGEEVQVKQIVWGEMLFMDDMEVMKYGVMTDPVAERSWCLQERLISPRVLNYGRWPTWRCAKAQETDGSWYIGSDPTIGKADEIARLLLRLTRDGSGANIDHFTLNKLLRAWYGVVNDYTQRHLSDPLDRLPAIDGIASSISQVTGMNYIAGLWRENLLHDLTWYADTREWLARPVVTRAPTWSWAAVDASISYGHIDDEAISLAQVVDASVGEAAAFGVIEGEIWMRGPIREVPEVDVLALFKSQDLRPAVTNHATLVDFYRITLESSMVNQGEKRFTEEQTKESLPHPLFAIVTFRHEKRVQDEQIQDGPFYSGLLVRPVKEHYERIGSFKQERTGWLEIDDTAWEEKTVVLR